MRELTMNEVQDVNGGLLRGLIMGWRVIRRVSNDNDVDGNAASEGEMPDYNDRNGE